jgi:acylphosphatase
MAEDMTGKASVGRTAVSLRIEGRVQGVGYRWWAGGVARRLGVDGWVRNRREGWVELMAIGDPAVIDQLVQACRQGPSAARVTAVVPTPVGDDGSRGFEERATL